MLRALVLILLTACMASNAPKPPKERIETRRTKAEKPEKNGPTALPEEPSEGERPELIDSSLAIEIDNGRGGKEVRVGVAFALHGVFAADDVVRFRLLTPGGRPLGKAVRCPQRASRRSGMRVTCRARGGDKGAQLPRRAGQYRFRVEHLRDGKPYLMRKGRFAVFPCSFGLCLDKDYLTGEHWAEFEGHRLTFRVTLKRRPSMPALHKNPKRQARAKAAFPIETVSSKCKRGKTLVGKTSESFEILDDDGVWTTLRVRAGLGVKKLKKAGAGKLRCELRINGRDQFSLDMRLDDEGGLVVDKKQRRANNPIRSPWFWLSAARRPKRLDANARVSLSVKRLRLLGK